MDRYREVIDKYKDKDNKPSVLKVIEDILIKAGDQGASLREIYATLEVIGFNHDNSVIRAYMNRNIVGSPRIGGHNLWYRKGIGIYISKEYYSS